MEPQTSQPVVAKKAQNIIRIILFMLKEGIAKSKLMLDLHLLLKRGKLAAAKAIANTLTLHHHRRHQHSSVSPQDYEFSCSNSPAIMFPIIKRHNKKYHHSRRHNHHYEDISTVHAVQKMLEMLNNSDKVEASPLVALPGFGKSPIGIKQLRITDSPFPLKDEEGDHNNQVDLAAEEFIKRFYKDLNLQQKMAAIESPYHRKFWDR
ncbi:uncharacterized protein LOC130739013 [Lotus japonicus]|uniref:uncharacterized protein LOC130739013 n=1 Tax=Lotus japonicus TaxID=34305 RepID=UPI00258683FF|nr:uncharacterized protein LOC130739013 [Lotus japonicus]